MSNLTLAITTIGDLLLNEKISKDKDGKSIDNVRLTIPDYQRPYKWTARNAIQLLDDIIEAKNSNKEVYRVGTLILHNEKGCYNIVDGQQRTITFSLLLYALYEMETDEKRREINFLNQTVYNNAYSRRNIPNNLNAFRRRVYKSPGEEENIDHVRDMKNLRDFIEQRCEMIVVITDDLSEAFQFFDSQNARGKALYPHDLLKAYHLREMTDVDEKTTEEIVNEWESAPQSKLASLLATTSTGSKNGLMATGLTGLTSITSTNLRASHGLPILLSHSSIRARIPMQNWSTLRLCLLFREQEK